MALALIEQNKVSNDFDISPVLFARPPVVHADPDPDPSGVDPLIVWLARGISAPKSDLFQVFFKTVNSNRAFT